VLPFVNDIPLMLLEDFLELGCVHGNGFSGQYWIDRRWSSLFCGPF